MKLGKEQSQEIIKTYGSSSHDSGRTEVQIAFLTTKIKLLTEHLKNYKGDTIAKYGLLKHVGKRKRFLRYLKSKDIVKYRSLLEKLGLRH